MARGLAGLLEQPLPRPGKDAAGYASARILEALLEGFIALRFLEEGLTRNAAGKAFQAWRALTAALLALEKDRLLKRLKSEEQKKWLLERAIPRAPSSRLRALGQLVEDAGYPGFSAYTAVALLLHDYQGHGPDPAGELSKYTTRGEAARDVIDLLERLAAIVKERAKPRLKEAGKWTQDHEEALERLRERLAKPQKR